LIDADEDGLQVNPIAVASAFLDIVRLEFPDCEEEEPNEKAVIFAKRLQRKFLHMLDDYVFREEDEITREGMKQF